MSEKRDDGTRIVFARINVNPKDPKKCGRCDHKINRRDGSARCGLYRVELKGKSPSDLPFKRTAACRAAEVKVDEDNRYEMGCAVMEVIKKMKRKR